MKFLNLKYLALIVGSSLLVFAFQNCGQSGGIVENGADLQKAGAQDPLVVEVADEMDRQEQEKEDEKKYSDDDKKKCDDKKEGKKYSDHEKEDNKDDKKYSDELEDVFAEYACGDLKDRKVLVCHYPPGNSAAKREICVGIPALKAHLHHGQDEADHKDHLGECQDVAVAAQD